MRFLSLLADLFRARPALMLLTLAGVLPSEPPMHLNLLHAPKAPARRSSTDSVDEYALKAAFLYQFANYTRWPEAAFAAKETPIVFAILGKDPFDDHLINTLDGQRLGGRPLQLISYPRVEDVKSCHILFVSQSHAAKWTRLREKLEGTSVFTVSDIDGFARNGGVAELSVVDRNLKMTINIAAMRAAELEIGSQMLKLATRIEDKDADR